VAQVVQGEVDFSTLTGKICAELEPTPSPTMTTTGGTQASFDLPARPAAAVGWRAIAVWNLQGGVGRSTVAAALALEAAIRDDPAIEEALNLRRPAYYHSDTLRQAARTVGDLLFAPGATRKEAPRDPGKVYTLGPLRVRM
jgi:Mrp family chromosome partitioning ATPase